ncbi:hypothetical protein ACFYUR_18975 [Micromonospora haikouensis]|uniref:hypothetical protein n=1 Tax=Micromonospora haikouensis TaxID=686309 RepID=UPI0036D0EDBD
MADDRIELAALAAAGRVDFRLTYARTERRRVRPGALDGPTIPCAYGGADGQDGGWYDGRDEEPAGRSEAEWVDRYAGYAVNEAVHEALEWFRVDGRPWLDPHGSPAHEDEVCAAVDELVARLVAIRGRVLGEG